MNRCISLAKWGDMAAGEEAVDVGLGIPVFVAVAGLAEETVVADAPQVAVFIFKEDCKHVVDKITQVVV